MNVYIHDVGFTLVLGPLMYLCMYLTYLLSLCEKQAEQSWVKWMTRDFGAHGQCMQTDDCPTDNILVIILRAIAVLVIKLFALPS